jgi:hypothetical protein
MMSYVYMLVLIHVHRGIVHNENAASSSMNQDALIARIRELESQLEEVCLYALRLQYLIPPSFNPEQA